MTVYFQTNSARTAEELGIGSEITLFHGDAIDPRGEIAISAWGLRCTRIRVQYDVETMSISLGGMTANVDEVSNLMQRFAESSVVLEATTLGFAELFAIVSGIVDIGIKQIDIVYVEPENYTKIPGGDQFSLTETTRGYQPIPRAVVDLSSEDLEAGVFFLGFEPERLDRALEEHQMIANKEIKVVFGVPAFQPNWELNSIIPHLPCLEQHANVTVEYCSANDPEAAYECLDRTRRSLRDGMRMFVSPIGTKPCGIAAAIFASVFPEQVGLLYDHPRRSPKRTDGSSVWHRYKINFEGE